MYVQVRRNTGRDPGSRCKAGRGDANQDVQLLNGLIQQAWAQNDASKLIGDDQVQNWVNIIEVFN